MILVDATGTIFAYGFDAILEKGIVLPYTKELTNVGKIKNPRFFDLNHHIAIIN